MIIDVSPGQVEGKKGLTKTIDKASEKLALNILQVTMYSFPIESTIREAVSNSLDAVKEKNIAKEILSGKAKVEDYYIERIGEEFEASKFNKDYYDLDFLSDDDKVNIVYKENDGIGFCDTISISDEGCGISPDRFVKIVGLLYSTKRNNLKTIGGFGAGAKAPLATECDYFTIESCWNGKKVIANCYKYKTDFIISKFNLETGKENPLYTTDLIVDGEAIKIYYEPTDSKNYTKVTIPSKKINRNKYKDAVRTQLMYFKDVDFKIIDEDNDVENINFKCKVLYNSANIVVSDNNYYTRPHICIVKTEEDSEFINYGLLEFGELELEQKYGAIGIKCTPRVVVQNENGTETIIQEGVTLSPSRERVVFNEATKNYLVSKFNDVVKEASGLIEKELVETDFIQWLSKASKALNRFDNSSVIGKMSGIIDKEDISPIYNKTSISFKQNPSLIFDKYGIQARLVRKVEHYKQKARNIDRNPISDWSYWNPEHIYIQKEASNNTRDFYITTALSNGSFILLKEEDLDKFLDNNKVKVPDVITNPEAFAAYSKKHEDSMLNTRKEILNFLYESKFLKIYEDVIVPEDWKKTLEESEEKIDEKGNIVSLTPQEKRKLEQAIVVQTLKKVSDNNTGSNYSFTKREPKIIDFQSDNNVYYGVDDDKELLHLAANILDTKFKVYSENDWRVSRNHSAYITSLYLNNIKIVKVAEVIAKKYCKQHNKIQSLFYNLNTTTLEMESTEHIRDWYTAKLIDEQIEKLRFFYGFKTINNDLATIYEELDTFTTNNFDKREHSRNSLYGEKYKEVSKILDNMKELQLFVQDHKDNADLIAQKATELFSIDSIKNASILNMEMYNKFNLLLSYAEEVYPLLNTIKHIIPDGDPEELTADCERLIKEFLVMKKLDAFKIPDEFLQIAAVIEEEEVLEIAE